jgi:hypothetical protein
MPLFDKHEDAVDSAIDLILSKRKPISLNDSDIGGSALKNGKVAYSMRKIDFM